MTSATHRAQHMHGAPIHTPTQHLVEALATIDDGDPLTVYGALEMYGPRAVSSLLALNRARIVWARVGASIVPTLARVA
jgi:hypothetical protein